jgi:putative nucleotidyltransferase with HDIG domain
MPGMTGLELLDEIKTIDEDVMVVMISAVKDIESAIAAMSKGAYDYVSKPFKLQEVALTANKAIEKRNLILENKKYQRELERKVEERTVELKNALEELDKTYKFTLRAMVTALDTRDAETSGHSMRVVNYSMKLASIAGIHDNGKLKVLEYGALLHDIGKIGIPDAILNKPAKLSQDEWKIMKTHPQIGYQILHRIKFLDEVSQIVLYHHEKYNGSGYPQRLKGNQIPLGSRIFTVADAIDAMTSARPYREALSFDTAATQLEESSGIQFDPELIDMFFSVGLEYWKQEKDRIDQLIMEDSSNHHLI